MSLVNVWMQTCHRSVFSFGRLWISFINRKCHLGYSKAIIPKWHFITDGWNYLSKKAGKIQFTLEKVLYKNSLCLFIYTPAIWLSCISASRSFFAAEKTPIIQINPTIRPNRSMITNILKSQSAQPPNPQPPDEIPRIKRIVPNHLRRLPVSRNIVLKE